jgi:acyl CoA:acetate/3-ketoacid CoA transferase alpha subunit
MKMGDIKTNASPWVSNRKIKDLCAQYLSGNYLEKKIIQGQTVIFELVPQDQLLFRIVERVSHFP